MTIQAMENPPDKSWSKKTTWNTTNMVRTYGRKQIEANVNQRKPFTETQSLLRAKNKFGLNTGQAQKWLNQFKLDPRVETNHDGPLGHTCWLIPLAGYQEYRAETSK